MLNKIENIVIEYIKYLNKTNHSDNYINEYNNILNNINKYYNDIINYIYNININVYIDFCKEHNINNINTVFKNNITNIKFFKKNAGTSKSIMINCLFKGKPAIIKIFYNPLVDLNVSYSLLYEQKVNLKIKNYQNEELDNDVYKKYFPIIYEVGYIEFDYLFTKEFKDELYEIYANIYDNNLDIENIKNDFKNIFRKLLDNNIHDDTLNDSSYKFRLFKKCNINNKDFWVNLLLFFVNIKNKYIHISIVEDLTQYDLTDITEYYSKNNFINKFNLVNFNNNFFIILYQIFYKIYLLNEKLEIIHNDLHFENIIIVNINSKFRCVIIDYNLSYIKNDIYNIGIIKRFNLGVKNVFNKTYDIFLFITYIGTICIYKPLINKSEEIIECNNVSNNYNIYTYNHNNYKYLNKIFFKKNQILKDIVMEHIILYLNNKLTVPINYYNYPYDICSANDIINNKYLIKKLKKINYL